ILRHPQPPLFPYTTLFRSGVHSLVMNKVSPAERSGASALQLLVTFSANALAASIAGTVIARYGYPTMLSGAAVIGLVASLLFWRSEEHTSELQSQSNLVCR